MKALTYLFLLAFTVDLSTEDDGDRPVISAKNGELFIEPANGRSIYFRTRGQNSKIYVNEIDLTQALRGNITRYFPSKYDGGPPREGADVVSYMTGAGGVLSRLDRLENPPALVGNNASNAFLRHQVNSLSTQMRAMQLQINELLFKNDCNLGPCKNGGTCLRVVNGYYCQCPSNWEGADCNVDVNECRNFFGTDLGCQNGATCINRQGSYECFCASGWYGVHCTRRAKDCSGGDAEMCGHGVCVSVTTGTGIKCFCDQGWTKNGTDPAAACTTDVNECEQSAAPHCSVNPRVECINLPGSFRCGACPPGYEGDGQRCYDVDECVVNNGGCSQIPHVACHNTVGSRICGACPAGYLGDGTTCTWRGSCGLNNGGCHPSAKCTENLVIGAQFVQCTCPTGMLGDGVGIGGCYIPSRDLNSTNCNVSPCGPHGQCHQLEKGITCVCREGYTGSFCNLNKDLCADRPCRNGGVCTPDSGVSSGYRCECTAQYSGDRCQNRARTCGGVLDAQDGSIVYPLANTSSSYSHNSRCAWLIQTAYNKVINVTFTKFNLEHSRTCSFDFLQIHDGRSSASQLIGRFCGTDLPKAGNIISSGNNLYFWFHSDQTVSREGFSLHWTSVDPVCGGAVDATRHGVITSPGWPGKYPPDRDCTWHLTTDLGKRIQLHFFRIGLEAHVNCSYDYLEIFDGSYISDPLLERYCNTTQPAPLNSAGSEMLIHFHSDAYNSGEGFQISYAPVEGVPGCGGLYTQDKGEIASPSYNGKYLHNLLCDYKIQVPAYMKISLKISNFELERSTRCRFDYLEIYDGPTSNSKLVGKFCGKNFPANFVSSSNSIFMQFKTDQTMSRGGFRILYDIVCKETITGDSGILKSPGYPHNYPANRVCEYIISSSPGKAIQLSFQHFDLEDNKYYNCQYDNLEVRDGLDTNSTLLGRFCDQNLPSIQTSTHNYMYLKFTSDFSVSGTGFLANFSTIDVTCGGIYTARTGIINHPGEGSSRYENSQTCTWIILAPVGHNVRITWSRFELEEITRSCWSDYVEISERQEDGEDVKYGKFCGSRMPPAITSTSNELKILFRSDDSIRYGGFSLVYSISDSKTVCGGNFIKSHGFIHSPGWPNQYHNSKDCIWTIMVPVGQQILLNFSTFDVEQTRMCSDDFLEIRNGPSNSSPVIGKYCGKTIPKRITSHSNSLYLRFHSDSYLGGQGFNVEWDGTTTGCGGTLTSSSGIVASPNYPQPYSEDGECFWRIIVSLGSTLRISFTEIDLERTHECNADYIEIYDGHDMNSEVLGKYCAMDITTSTVTSKSNQVFIKFRSDVSIGGKGFSLNYYTNCNNNVTGFGGVIESPDFPNEYPSHLTCLWSINVPKSNKINITFTHFDLPPKLYNYRLRMRPSYQSYRSHYNQYYFRDNGQSECNSDYVQLKNGKDTDFNHSEKFCGNTLPRKIISSDNTINIKFLTGPSFFKKQGFRLEWVLDGCGGTIKKSFGFIPPLSAKTQLGEPIECEWLIETPTGTAVQIHITDINMRESPDCTVDSIEIYNGVNALSPQLMKICHKQNLMYEAVSTSNLMFLRLTSTSSYAGIHFRSNFVSTTSRCGGLFSGKSGTLTSPNFPKNYDKNMNCLWFIQVPVNYRIKLDITDLDLYTTDINSCKDSIKYFETMDITRTNYTRRYCGNINDPNKSFTSKGNIMAVQFTSGEYSAKGFKANFSVTCGSQIVSTGEGILKNYPSVTMHADQNCTWTIMAEKLEQKVSLTFTHIVIPRPDTADSVRRCSSDFLKVFDGNDEKAPLKGEYCSSKAPPTIVSQGNAITVQLGSYAGSVTGQFSAHYSVLNTACGGILTSEEGTITSPSYPGTYSMSTDCEWFLKTSPGNKVSMTFEKFDLERSSNCNEDYVEVRETDGGGKLLGVYCGGDVPANTTRAAQLYVKFHSDGSGTAPGFLAHYAFVHGNDISGSTFGDISSPLFPHYYHGAGSFTWRVTTKGNSYISLVIAQLEVDIIGKECYNYLSVHDGYDETAPVLKHLCGLLNPEDKDITTTSNMVYIKMYLDNSNVRSLFFLHWLEVDKGATTTDTSGNNCPSSGTVFVPANSSVDIVSPNYPNNYGDNLDCEWIYETIPGRHLKIKFSDFQIEQSEDCFMDYVKIYTGADGTHDWHAITDQLCLPTVTANISLETTNLMKVTLHTDVAVTKSGFNGSVSSLCGGILTDSSGYIEVTQSDKNVFSLITECVWRVKVKPRRTIVVNFQRFQVTSSDTSCTMNYVSLRNGDSIESPYLGPLNKYCGVNIPNVSYLETSGNTLYISYKSRSADMHNLHGFRLNYEEKSFDCGSSTRLDDVERWKVINSTNYPQPPLPISDCVWSVMSPPGEILRLEFIDRFVLAPREGGECVQEYVEVRDGLSGNSPLLGRYCERDEVGTSVKTTGNAIYVKFVTLLSEPNDGFKANISIDVCGGTLYSVGEITSPGYPKYPNLPYGTICEWRLVGRIGSLLWINPIDLSFPESERPCAIKVVVSESLPTNRSRLFETTLCSRNFKLDSIRSFSNEIVIKFFIEKPTMGIDTSHYRGFRLNFNSTGTNCGGKINSPTGFIQSPGYPLRINMRYCTWEIEVPDVTRRIRLEFLDLDNVSSDMYISAYNDFEYRAPILLYGQSLELPTRVLRSSGNTMSINVRARSSSLQRGFKAKFSSDEPSICGGFLQGDKGFINSPPMQLNESYFCHWRFVPRNKNELDLQTLEGTELDAQRSVASNNTLYLKVNMTSSASSTRTYCPFMKPVIRVKPTDEGYNGPWFYKDICNNGENVLRIPVPNVQINAYQSKDESLVFNIMWKLQPCGGTVPASYDNMNILNLPTRYNGSLDCAWYIRKESGTRINIKFNGSFSLPCSQEFLKIRVSMYGNAPYIAEYCQDKLPNSPISINVRYLYVEYHSDQFSNNTNIELKTTYENSNTCGGVLTGYERVLITPNYPKSYSNNQECTWDISTTLGNQIALKFLDRFQIEDAVNCTKDYVLILDWIGDNFNQTAKLCGRNLPVAVNSTSNRMKVIFRSDNTNTGDGFKARWEPICGGQYSATEKEQYLYSPNYPEAYPRFLDCVLRVRAPDKKVLIKFITFSLESSYGTGCISDNVTISQIGDLSNSEEQIFCGEDIPQLLTYQDGVIIRFQTDGSIQRRGFKIMYKLKTCGGEIKNHAIIKSSETEGDYEDNLNCIWNITAPVNKYVVIRFVRFDLEHSDECDMDYVAVYNGSKLDDAQRLGLLCGHLNTSLPTFRSKGSTMLVQFSSDYGLSYNGFEAEIYFSYGESVGCGGEIDMTTAHEKMLKSPLLGASTLYEKYLDCHWVVKTEVDKVIKIEFTAFHIAPCANANQTALGFSNCSCDTVRVRDGANPMSAIIGTYCGHTAPPLMSSSSNLMFVSLYTDGDTESSGFQARLTVADSQCGRQHYVASRTVQHIKSPHYDDGYVPRGLHCTYNVAVPDEYRLHIKITSLDLAPVSSDTRKCARDRFEVSGSDLRRNMSAGRDLVFSGHSLFGEHESEFFLDMESPTKHTLCGTYRSVEFYVTDSVTLRLATAADDAEPTHRGFDVEISSGDDCARNYSGLQGLIQSARSTEESDCYTVIEAPENHTISVYFFYLSSYWSEAEEYVDVLDGATPASTRLARLGETDDTHAAFSTGRYMTIHRHGRDYYPLRYLLNYAATAGGRGCGGRLHAAAGLLTSPLYPEPYRAVRSCEFELEALPETRLVLRFKSFDLGARSTCEQVYVELADRAGRPLRTYCSDDRPADFTSEDNYVKLVYRTTMNTGGPGWVAQFMGLQAP